MFPDTLSRPPSRHPGRRLATPAAAVSLAIAAGAVAAQDRPLEGMTLTVASMNDQFSTALVDLAPRFEEQTGAELRVDILGYGELLTKTTADFIGNTETYDLVTMDIVWAGSYAQNGHSVDLTDWVERNADELALDDIYPEILRSIGQYDGRYVAFPLAAYANVLAYRTDWMNEEGLSPPETMEEFVSHAKTLTEPDDKQFGFVANGQAGAPSAQDWMQYNNQFGGSIMGPDGMPALNSPANVASLEIFKELFTTAAPPGATGYDWGAREQSFRQGLVAMMQTWSVGAPGYSDPESSNVVGDVGIAVPPVAEGVPTKYGIGGWGIAINADISEDQQEAAKEFIKWIVSPEIHKEFNMLGAGAFMRKSQMTDEDLLAEYSFLPVLAEVYANGDGDYRPRIPQYPEMQDYLGTAVNSVLAGEVDAQTALDEAQAKAMDLF